MLECAQQSLKQGLFNFVHPPAIHPPTTHFTTSNLHTIHPPPTVHPQIPIPSIVVKPMFLNFKQPIFTSLKYWSMPGFCFQLKFACRHCSQSLFSISLCICSLAALQLTYIYKYIVPSGIQSTEADGRLLSVNNSTSKPL